MATTDIGLMDLDESLDITGGYILLNKGGTDYRVPVSLFMLTANNLSEGVVSLMRTHLKLDEYIRYGSSQVGSLLFWPSAQMPNEVFTDMTQEFLPYMGQSFDGVRYPDLAKLHPSLKLPVDMRGEFIRGFDNGRGVDNARTLLSAQAATMLRTAMSDYFGDDSNTGNLASMVGMPFAQADSMTNTQPGTAMSPYGDAASGPVQDNAVQTTLLNTGLAASKIPSGKREYGNWISLRPRNVAWNMIVRAK